MRRCLFLLTLVTAIILFVLMNRNYLSTVYHSKQILKSNGAYEEDLVTIEGNIIDYNLENNSFSIAIDKFNNRHADLKWMIRIKDENILSDIVENRAYHLTLQVNINQFQYTSAKNFNYFDYDLYLFSNGITNQYFLKNLLEASKCPSFCPHCFRLDIRKWIQIKLNHYFNASQSGFLQALILGEKKQFEQYETYKNLGLAHIFAISGLHFGLIYQYFRKILFVKSAWIRSCIIISFMAFMLFVVGSSYSAQRAFIMIVYAEMCHLTHRKSDIYINLALSLLIILMIQPVAILSTSLHLSYYAYICVAIVYRAIFKKAFKFKALEALRFSFAIQILLLPVTIYYFQSANLFGFISNAIAVPLSAIILPLAFLLLILAALKLNSIAWLVSQLLVCLVKVFDWIGKWLPLNLNYFVHFKKNDFYAIILYALIISISLVFWNVFTKRKAGHKAILILLLFTFIFVNFVEGRQVSVTFFDVGHGDMSLIQTREGNVLIDTGDGKVSSNSVLRGRGIHSLDLLVLSHAHNDHIGDVVDLLENIVVKKVLVNSSTFIKLIEMAPEIESMLTIVDKPIKIELDTGHEASVHLSVIPIKGPDSEEDPNNDALIVSFDYGESNGYFLADIGTEAIDAYFISMKLESIDFIKSAHHGSKTSISSALYENHSIGYVLTSCGTRFSMPHITLEERLEENKILHFITYNFGEIQLELTPKRLKIKTYLKP